jgi:hypothetical protein
MHIKASVEVCGDASTSSTSPETIDINELAKKKRHKLTSQPSATEQPSSSSHQPRRGGLRGGDHDAAAFYYEFDVTDDDGKQGHALLHLKYYPFKEGVETLPEGCAQGFDVRFVHSSPHRCTACTPLFACAAHAYRALTTCWLGDAGGRAACSRTSGCATCPSRT